MTDFGWRFPHKLNFGSLWNEIAKSVELHARLTFNTQRFSTLRVSNIQSCVIVIRATVFMYLGQCNQYWAAGFAQDPSSGAERCRGNSKNEVGFLDALFEKVTTWECLKTKSPPESGGTPLISFPSKPIPNKSCHHAYMLLFYAGFIDCKLIQMINSSHPYVFRCLQH